MAKYTQVPFTEIATLIRGVSYNKSVASVSEREGYIPILRANNIQKNLVLTDLVYVPSDLVKEEQMIRKGDIVLAMSSGSKDLVGKSAQADTNIGAAFGTFCGLIRAKENVDSKFLGLYFQTQEYRNFVSYQSQGVNICNLKKKDIESLQIPLPPLPTQHAIVTRIETLFAELDKAVQHLRTAQQQLKTYRQAVLNHWLTNGSEKWQQTTIGNIVEKVEYGSSAKSEKEGKIPVLRMGNIQKGRFDWSDLVYSNNDEEINKYLLKKDDVLFNRTNSPELVGKTAIYKGERPAIFAGYLIRLHYKKDLINADFLNYFLNSDIARNYGNTVKSDGVNQSNINGQKLKTYPIALPPLADQHRIVQEIESRLSQATASETYIENALQQAEALRQSILKKAFSGELV